MRRTPVCIAVVLAAMPARAQPPPSVPHVARLVYAAPAGCPTAQVFQHLVEANTPLKVLAPEARAPLVVKVLRRDRVYDLTAELRDADDAVVWTRRFGPASSCTELEQIAAIYVADKLEPRAESAPPSPPPPPTAAGETSATQHPPPKRSAMADPLLVVLGLGATLGFGVAPRPAVGMTADVGLHWSFADAPIDGFSLSLGARWDPHASADAPTDQPVPFPGARVGSSRFIGTLAPCGHWWKLYGCAVGELGMLRGGGENIFLPRVGSATYAEAGGRIGVEVPFGSSHFGFRGYGELLGRVIPVRILVGGLPWWTQPPVSASAGAGLFASF